AYVTTTHRAKRVDIRMPLARPIHKFDPQFEGPLRFAHEVVFIQPQLRVIEPDLRYGCFTYTHGANFFGLNQTNGEPLAKYCSQGGSRHPTGCAATDDDDVCDVSALHDCLTFIDAMHVGDGATAH